MARGGPVVDIADIPVIHGYCCRSDRNLRGHHFDMRCHTELRGEPSADGGSDYHHDSDSTTGLDGRGDTHCMPYFCLRIAGPLYVGEQSRAEVFTSHHIESSMASCNTLGRRSGQNHPVAGLPKGWTVQIDTAQSPPRLGLRVVNNTRLNAAYALSHVAWSPSVHLVEDSRTPRASSIDLRS
jgi:hypothetical protein